MMEWVIVASEVIKCMIKKDINIKGSNILILGITFKENCPDIINTKFIDLIKSLKSYGVSVSVFDPWANESEVLNEYGLLSLKHLPENKFDALVLAVAHSQFVNLISQILKRKFGNMGKKWLTSIVDRKL